MTPSRSSRAKTTLNRWLLVVAAPPLAILLALLFVAADNVNGLAKRFEAIRGDGEALVALRQFAASLDREVHATGVVLAEIELAGRDPVDAARSRARLGDSLAAAEQRLFATLSAGLEADRDDAGDESAAPLVAHADSTYHIVAAYADSARHLAYDGKLTEARLFLHRAARAASDRNAARLRARLAAETEQLSQRIGRLADADDRITRLSLGGSGVDHLDRLESGQSRLLASLAVARAFQELHGEVLTPSDTTAATLTRARRAIALLASNADTAQALVTRARRTLAAAANLVDSVAARRAANRETRSLIARQLSIFSGPDAESIDSLPMMYLGELHANLTWLGGHAVAVRSSLLVVGLLALVLAVAFPIFASRQVVRPIVRLTEASKRVADGDFNVELPASGLGEIGELNRGFARMATDLGRLMETQRVTERQLRESESRQRADAERLRHLLASGPAVVFNLTPTNPPSTSFISDNVFEQTGYSSADFMGPDNLWGQLVHPDDFVVLAEGLPSVFAGGRWTGEYRLRYRDGEYRWLRAQIAPVFDDSGTLTSITGWWIDITETRRTAEIQRSARETAEAASRAKSEFLANMSHEIRTPMNGVMGMLELVLDTELPHEQREYLEVAHSSAESLLGVINDVLDFSKIEAGKMELDPSAFRLAEALEDTLSGLALRAHDKGLELALQIDAAAPESVVADLGRLRQIIINLVGNAIKFTDLGEVVLHVGVVESSDNDAQLRFTVRDTGIGIPADKQRHIFEAFAQADSSATRVHGGTGLGLAIATRLVHLMGGRISLESEVRKGSSFSFTVRVGIANVMTTGSHAARNLDDVSVLVVDDNATNRAILQGMLSRWGMRATVVDGGAAALALLRSEQAGRAHFDLLIVDAQMPGMDGFTLVERVRADRSCGEPAIMMLSSATFHDDVRRCREVGIDLYLTKPVRGGELRSAIATLLSKKADAANDRRRRTPAPGAVARSSVLRVLLVEDNAVNQRLALALLKRRGAVVTIAQNGREAIEAWSTSRFDVVLMDVQMPEMDGFDATRIIRARERGGEHVPIIALTARAMTGDRERCLAAGMDDYVTKPLRAQVLMEAIDRLVGAASVARPAETTPKTPTPSVIDLDGLRENTDDDDALVAELLDLFRNDAPRYLDQIRTAVSKQEGGDMQRAAHALKGAAKAIYAGAVAEAAAALEQAGRAGLLHDADAMADHLAVQLALLDATIGTLPLASSEAFSN